MSEGQLPITKTQYLIDGLVFMLIRVIITLSCFNYTQKQLIILNSIFLCFGIIRSLAIRFKHDRGPAYNKKFIFYFKLFLLIFTHIIFGFSLLIITSFYENVRFLREKTYENLKYTNEKEDLVFQIIFEHEDCIFVMAIDSMFISLPLLKDVLVEIFQSRLSKREISAKSNDYPLSLKYSVEVIHHLFLSILSILYNGHLIFICESIFSIVGLLSVCFMFKSYTVTDKYVRKYIQRCKIVDEIRKTFPNTQNKDFDNNKCTICWESLHTNLTLPCKHSFHEHCLCSWLERDNSCPICRTKLNKILTSIPPVNAFSSTNETEQNTHEEQRPQEGSVNGRQFAFSFRFDICLSFGANSLRSAQVASWANSYIPLFLNFNRPETTFHQDVQTSEANNNDQGNGPTPSTTETHDTNERESETTNLPDNGTSFDDIETGVYDEQSQLSANDGSETRDEMNLLEEENFESNTPPQNETNQNDFSQTNDNTNPEEEEDEEEEIEEETGRDNTQEEPTSNIFHNPRMTPRTLMIQARIGANQRITGYTSIHRQAMNMDGSRYFTFLPSLYVEMVEQSGSFVSFGEGQNQAETHTAPPSNSAAEGEQTSTENKEAEDSLKSKTLKSYHEKLVDVENQILNLEHDSETVAEGPLDREKSDEFQSLNKIKQLHSLRMKRTSLQRLLANLEKEMS